jgi:hypothetical protein
MLLTNISYASPKESFNLVAISGLQECEDSNVTRLKLMWSIRGDTA